MKHLDLHGTNVTDAGLEHLHRFQHLVAVTVSSTAVTRKGLERLENCPVLYTIQMEKAQGAEALEEYFKAKNKFMQVWHEGTPDLPTIRFPDDD